jgi:nicotinamidase-related amidase
LVVGHSCVKFNGTSLGLSPRILDNRSLVITGMVTDVCIHGTLLSAANLEYRVTALTHWAGHGEDGRPQDVRHPEPESVGHV